MRTGLECIMKSRIAYVFPNVAENLHRYESLRAPLNNLKRVHVDKHFVLLFSVNEESKSVILEDYDHPDNIYKH